MSRSNIDKRFPSLFVKRFSSIYINIEKSNMCIIIRIIELTHQWTGSIICLKKLKINKIYHLPLYIILV